MRFIDMLDDARALQDFCDQCGWRSCLIAMINELASRVDFETFRLNP
jgi:hypothetical protein